jgi:hypothetical protein
MPHPQSRPPPLYQVHGFQPGEFNFSRNLVPDITQYLANTERQVNRMNDQDSATIIITFLLLIPWLGRTAMFAMAAWREHTETQRRKAREN